MDSTTTVTAKATTTAAATPTTGTEATEATEAAEAAEAADAKDVITGERARIDQLDGRIIGLVRERMEVSARIQAARIDSGGRRVHLSREMEILERYRAELGRPGTELAMTLLALCRGQR